MFIIGIDPHKGSHTAAVIDGDEQVVGEVLVRADRRQRERLLRWAAPFEPRLWAVEGATGHGALLAQQLVASGETVVDVPAALSARARLLDSGRKDKTDAHDARSAAIVALRHRNLRAVALEDHRQILRLLARRHHQLTAARTRAICRLHAVLARDDRRRIVQESLGETGRVRAPQAPPGRRDRRSNANGSPASSSTRSAASTAHSSSSTHASSAPSNAADTTVDRRVRCRPDRRVLPHRLQRRRSSVPNRGALRPLQRDRTDRSVVGPEGSAPAEPEREPATEPRDPHRRARTDQPRHTRPRLLPRANKPKGSHAKKRCAA